MKLLQLFSLQSRRSWIQATFSKRDCVTFLPASRDHHRCYPVCQVCQSLVRCCCGRLIAEHVGLYSGLLGHVPGPDEEEWSVLQHTSVSPTDAFGSLDFQGSTKRTCRAKYVRLSYDTPPELLVQLMLREWHMEMPKLVISVHGGTDNFPLSPRVCQAFSTGLITAAESTGAWILTDGINTGVSKYVGDAVKVYGSHDHRKRNVVGIPPWGIIENNSDLIGQDVLRHYQALGNPLSKRASLNGMHSHFLLVDDGTMGKSGCQIDLRKRLERHIHFLKIHPRLPQHVPLVCVVVEGGPAILSVVLEYVRRSSPVPVLVFEGTGRAADLLALIHKQTAVERHVSHKQEASELLSILMECMEYRELITIFDSESEDLQEADVAILTTSLRGTRASPEEQLNITLAWDRADVAKDNILVYGQQWQVGSLEQTMLDALVMDRVSFVKLLIENGMTMRRFLTISRLEQLYNIHKGSSDHFLRHIIEDAKQTRLPAVYRISLIDIGMVIEYLIGGAYRSTYTRKSFRAMYSHIHNPTSSPFSKARKAAPTPETSPSRSHFHRTARPCRHQEGAVAPQDVKSTSSPEFLCTFNDLFVWAVLKHRQEMAMFLWQHGEQAMARAVVACKLYRAMAVEAGDSNMGDSMAEELKKNSLEFGQLAVDLLDQAFRENERMAMKLLTWEMKDWSNFTCLQMAVSSRLRPFVAHNCTQMLLTDLWMGRLNLSKNSWFKIIASILMPVAIQMLEFKNQAEMSHVPQPQEALQFGWDPGSPGASEQEGAERGSRCLCPWTRKVYDFYTAPVVKFWFHTMAFLGFLMMFSYTVLVRLDEKPNIQECLVITYILTMAAEKAREVLVLEPRKFTKKLKVWFSEYWNINDFMGILLFLVGVSLRWHQETRLASHIVYSLDFIFWSVRLLDLFAVNQHAGPYLTMITKMMSNMFYIVVIMAIVLVSFGTSRKSILSPNEDPSWNLLRDVVFQPYWMIFGEVYAGEIDACSNPETCVPGAFLTPFLQAVYLFVQYIIMVNVLIAFFNNVYFDMSSISRKLWKYNRYRYIMTYQEKPWLPPPLILLSHVTLCLSSMWQKHRKASKRGRTGLKLLLAPDDLKKLHEFEEKCVTGYFRDKKESQQGSQINQIRSAADKTEEMAGILVEVAEKISIIQDNMHTLDGHLGQLQDLSALAVDTLNFLSATDNQQQEVARLGQSQPIACRHEQVSHSCCLRIGGSVAPSQALPSPKHYRSMPPSLLRGLGPGRQRPSLELPPGTSVGPFEVRSKCMSASPEEEDCSFRWPLQRGDSREETYSFNPAMRSLWRKRMMRTTYMQCPDPPAIRSCLQIPTVMGIDHWGSETRHSTGLMILDTLYNLKYFVLLFCGYDGSLLVSGVFFFLSAMERNNLMRLAHSIPFTPVSLLGGVEVCIYTLEETEAGSSLEDQSSKISTWIQHGRTAVLQPLAHQEVLDGGLRRATKVVCTWAEGVVLKLGSVYVVKAFRPEVVRIWQKVFPISTSLHLCLREIQQQRAAQKLMQRFNQIKPSSVPYSPRFLDVSLLHWRSDGQWLTVEKNMSGHFRKYNNNTGEEISPSSGLEEAILAFSHWTYEYTNRELLVLDLQGVGADLTDPSLIRFDDKSSSGEMAFGPANLGDDAIQSFVLKHTCNSCCKKLGLSGEVTLMSQGETDTF
uniref:non-specific serine/threonine protein kinase n=1 Tax=Sinocyclocheilus anshuiensis TaxID=1608454 RepID=A0A671NUK1_9TELE